MSPVAKGNKSSADKIQQSKKKKKTKKDGKY